MSLYSKRLRQLNLQGLDKVSVIAAAQYIEQIEKELSLYKSLESRGMLLKLRFSVNSKYWTAEKYCTGLFNGDAVQVVEDMCTSCSHKEECSKYMEYRPQFHAVYSLEQAVILSSDPLAFAYESECRRYCNKKNKELSGSQSKVRIKQPVDVPSSYVSRSELADEKVEQLRQADRDYYEEHKEEVNQKDRDKYHRLHPNARYYKKRNKPNKESLND